MQIAGYLKTSLIEWPGKIAAVIFVPGCNFRCPFCHNRDLVENPALTLLDEKQIFADLEKRKKWLDAVVVTGGEPTLQSDLGRFLSRLKRMGFETMVETNGSEPEVIRKLAISNLVNFIAMDYKGSFDNYQNFTNVPARLASEREAGRQYLISNIRSSMEAILKSGVEREFRTTIVPALHNERTLIEMATELKKITDDCGLATDSCHWVLQNFRPKNCLDPEYEKRKPFTPEQMKDFVKAVRKIIPQTGVRGA